MEKNIAQKTHECVNELREMAADGELGQFEFQQAWFFLGLKGSESEVADVFKSVDKNNSGLID